MHTAPCMWSDCRLETNSLCWHQTVGGDNIPVLRFQCRRLHKQECFWFLLPYLESVLTVVLCRFWPQYSRCFKRLIAEIRDTHHNNLTLLRVRANTGAVKEQWVLTQRVCVCVCVFNCGVRYPACNAHAPYCHLWTKPLYNIFPHFLTKGTIFEKKLLTCPMEQSPSWEANRICS